MDFFLMFLIKMGSFILCAYVALVVVFKDWNIKRGLERDIQKIVSEAFKEAREESNV